jgi:hypothetical protein
MSLALAVSLLPSLSFAQHEHRATVVMRNGERVAGLLEDVENGTVYVRVSQHDQRRLGVGDVALIDLVGGGSGLPDTEVQVARNPEHLAVLRDGNSIRGTFIDIRGGEEGTRGESHSLIFRSSSGEQRQISLDQVGRIYFGNFPGSTTAASKEVTSYTTSSGALPANTIRVPGNATWVATPLVVRRGDRVGFNVEGRIQLSDDANDVAISAGSLRQRMANGSPLPQNLAGALIGRVGNSAPFAIGNSASITMPADGQLYLGINDDEVGDNRGEFTVTLTHNRQTRRR